MRQANRTSMSRPRRSKSEHVGPKLGLVCITWSQECRFRVITRTRYLQLPPAEQEATLRQLYWDNLQRLHWTLAFCARRDIRLYRATSALFPLSDEPLGESVLRSMAANLSSIGRRAKHLGIRIVLHPDQFVVLNSESPDVAATSVKILEKHALAFDLLALPRSAWATMLIHGGKSGRGEQLVNAIAALPENVKSRLALENDEYAFGAADILDLCNRAGVPMVFDAHHHVIKEKLDSYEHPSVAKFTRAARATWPRPDWQIVHLSNGVKSIADRTHSDFITQVPSAYAKAPWVEVEAKGKEEAIERLRQAWPAAR